MELNAHLGGRPGIDCGGFCEFCFYKNVDFNKLSTLSTGCAYCPPNQIGCDYCRKTVTRIENNFKKYEDVLKEIGRNLLILESLGKLNYQDLRITISGGADAFFYPHLNKVISALKYSDTTIHLGYVSGRGINDKKQAEDLIALGVDEVSFSIFSTDPQMRKKWMHDKNPEEVVRSFRILCEDSEVNASSVIIPGVNDEDDLNKTCAEMEEWGIKSFILRRFANTMNQGLILNNNGPILKGVTTHSYEEFQDLVSRISQDFSFPVYGLPYFDPKKDSPFAILENKNVKYIQRLPEITHEATIITSKLSYPYLKKFFKIKDKSEMVNVVAVEKEIADLIVKEDLESIDLEEVKTKVIIPGGALVHNKQATKILSKDGLPRKIIRGPNILTNHSSEFNSEEFIKYEYKSFEDLINKINTSL